MTVINKTCMNIAPKHQGAVIIKNSLQRIKQEFNIDIKNHSAPFVKKELNYIENILIDFKPLLKKYPLKSITKNTLDANSNTASVSTGDYIYGSKSITYNCAHIEHLDRILRHELTHHISLQAFTLKEWMQLARLGGWKILSPSGRLIDPVVTAKIDLCTLSEGIPWYSKKPNILFSYLDLGFNNATKDKGEELGKLKLSVKYRKKKPNIYFTHDYRYKNIIDMVAEDLYYYIKDPKAFIENAKQKISNKSAEGPMLIKELELFRRLNIEPQLFLF